MQMMARGWRHSWFCPFSRNEALGVLPPDPRAPTMSGPTWLPPRTLDSPERAVPQMSHSASSSNYRNPNKKGMSDFRPKYGPYDQNGGAGVMANRYASAGPAGDDALPPNFTGF